MTMKDAYGKTRAYSGQGTFGVGADKIAWNLRDLEWAIKSHEAREFVDYEAVMRPRIERHVQMLRQWLDGVVLKYKDEDKRLKEVLG